MLRMLFGSPLSIYGPAVPFEEFEEDISQQIFNHGTPPRKGRVNRFNLAIIYYGFNYILVTKVMFGC